MPPLRLHRSRIRNPNGFLAGIIKRVRLDGPDRGAGKVDMLPRAVRHRLEDVIDDVSRGGVGVRRGVGVDVRKGKEAGARGRQGRSRSRAALPPAPPPACRPSPCLLLLLRLASGGVPTLCLLPPVPRLHPPAPHLPAPQRKMTREEVDQRMVRALADMPAHLAEEAVVRYSRSLDDHVRNRQGFMVSGGGGGGACVCALRLEMGLLGGM